MRTSNTAVKPFLLLYVVMQKHSVLLVTVLLFVVIGQSCADKASEARSNARLAIADSNYVQAVTWANVVLEKDPANVEMLSLRSRSFMLIGEHQKALDDIHLVFKLTADTSVLVYSAHCAAELQDYGSAQRECTMVIEYDSTLVEARRERARARMGLGQYAMAIKDLLVYLTTKRQVQDAWNSLGLCYRQVGSIDSAMHCYDIAIQLDPADWKPYYNRSILLAEQEEYGLALVDCTRAIELGSQSRPMLKREEGKMHYLKGDSAGACLCWAAARSLGDDEAASLFQARCKQ